MKSLLDKSTRDEVISRIHTLHDHSHAQWGKMSVAQMMKHCYQWDEMALGKRKYKQSLIGKLFGKMALKDMLNDEPMKKNLPTVPSFKIKDPVDFSDVKTKWLKILNEYDLISEDGFIHPFFGLLTKEQTGYMAYKHLDHHLRQFNACIYFRQGLLTMR